MAGPPEVIGEAPAPGETPGELADPSGTLEERARRGGEICIMRCPRAGRGPNESTEPGPDTEGPCGRPGRRVRPPSTGPGQLQADGPPPPDRATAGRIGVRAVIAKSFAEVDPIDINNGIR